MEQLNYDSLKLENQLCFPLYAASREVIKQYRPYLDELGLLLLTLAILMPPLINFFNGSSWTRTMD